MVRIYQIDTDRDRVHVRQLFWVSLQWANAGAKRFRCASYAGCGKRGSTGGESDGSL